MKKYQVRAFFEMSISYECFESVKEAFKIANRLYREHKTCVVLDNILTNRILYSRCDNDYATDQFLRFMDDKPNVFNKITSYKTV